MKYTPQPRQSRAWMITFTDLVSLLLTFFVMLFAMSNVKVDQWDSMIDALSQTLNPETTKAVASATARFNIPTTYRKRAINLEYLAAILGETVAEDALLRRARLISLEDRLIIALPGDLLFAPARAELTEQANRALFNLGGVLRNLGNEIGVNGHSDPVPPAGGLYPSNWELSLARAATVAGALRRSGYTEPITAYGYSDTHFASLPDLPPEQRRAMGRRVDIVVLPTVRTER